MPTYNSKLFGRMVMTGMRFPQVCPLWVATYESELDVVKYLASKGAMHRNNRQQREETRTAHSSREWKLGHGEILGRGVWCQHTTARYLEG